MGFGILMAQQELVSSPPSIGEAIAHPLHSGELIVDGFTETRFLCSNINGEKVSVCREHCYRVHIAIRFAADDIAERAFDHEHDRIRNPK